MTRGFWGNKNGHARILDHGLLPQDIGGLALAAPQTDCGESVTSIGESDNILTGTVEGYNALAAGGDCGLDGSSACPGQPGKLGALDGGVCPHELGNLAAHTLALTYNVADISGFGSQPLSVVAACITAEGISLGIFGAPALTLSSTYADVLERSNLIINDAAFVEVAPPDSLTVTPAMVEAMTILLGHCVNQE